MVITLHCPSPLHPPTWNLLACSMLLRNYQHSHTSLYIPCTAVNGFLFAFFTIEDGTARLLWNVDKELALLTKFFLKLFHNRSFILQRWHLRWYWEFYFDFHVYMTHGSRWCTPDIIIVTIFTLVALKLVSWPKINHCQLWPEGDSMLHVGICYKFLATHILLI